MTLQSLTFGISDYYSKAIEKKNTQSHFLIYCLKGFDVLCKTSWRCFQCLLQLSTVQQSETFCNFSNRSLYSDKINRRIVTIFTYGKANFTFTGGALVNCMNHRPLLFYVTVCNFEQFKLILLLTKSRLFIHFFMPIYRSHLCCYVFFNSIHMHIDLY